jgi:hypothetical protein
LAPRYHCSGEHLVEGRGSYCRNIDGVQIDEAVARAFLAALEPAKIAAMLAAAEQLEMNRAAALKHWRLGLERASYAASLAERRYRAVDPDNRLAARGLERAWQGDWPLSRQRRWNLHVASRSIHVCSRLRNAIASA